MLYNRPLEFIPLIQLRFCRFDQYFSNLPQMALTAPQKLPLCYCFYESNIFRYLIKEGHAVVIFLCYIEVYFLYPFISSCIPILIPHTACCD